MMVADIKTKWPVCVPALEWMLAREKMLEVEREVGLYVRDKLEGSKLNMGRKNERR